MTPSYPLITNSKRNPHSGALSHYCKTWDVILSILKTGLKFSYCLEKFSSYEIGIPMVSFCDVPIFKNDEHTERYGNYTLAISKEYLYNKYPYCAPVRYIRSDDPIFSIEASLSLKCDAVKEIERIILEANGNIADEVNGNPPIIVQDSDKVFKTISFAKFKEIITHENNITKITQAYYTSLGYLKSISEDRKRNNEIIQQSNYDECEWRIITIPNQLFKTYRTPD